MGIATRTILTTLAVVFAVDGLGAREPIRWGADAEGGLPYLFKDPTDPTRNIGFEVELMDDLARRVGRPVKFTQYEFRSLIVGLQRGDFDLAMCGLEVTADRKQVVTFGRPYFAFRNRLVARQDETRFETLEDCVRLNLKIGTMEDTAAQRELVAAGVRFQVYDDPVNAYQDLALKRIDGVYLDGPIALYYAQPDTGLRYAQPTPGLKVVGPPGPKGYYALAFPKGETELIAAFNEAIESALKDGTIERIYRKWGLWDDAQAGLLDAGLADVGNEAVGDWRFRSYFPLLLDGAMMTIFLSVTSMALAVVVGLILAVVLLYGPWPMRWAAIAYIGFFRGIPVLLLLFFLYYGLPNVAEGLGIPAWTANHLGVRITLQMSPLQAAILGLGMNYAAYEAEVYRAGIQAVPEEQWEAAASLGMPAPLVFRRVIMPQAIRGILPPATNDFVSLFKDTSIVSVIAVVELTKQYQMLAKSSLKYLELGLLTAGLYLLMAVPLDYLSRYLERRWARQAEDE